MRFLSALLKEVELVDVTEEVFDCRDPKDNKFLELAVDGKAEFIITGDDDLFDPKSFSRSFDCDAERIPFDSLSRSC